MSSGEKLPTCPRNNVTQNLLIVLKKRTRYYRICYTGCYIASRSKMKEVPVFKVTLEILI